MSIHLTEGSNDYLAGLVFDRLHRLCVEQKSREGADIVSPESMVAHLRRESRELVDMLVVHGRVRERGESARDGSPAAAGSELRT